MKFLHPNFLWALLCLAIPIIIHLFYFRRYKKVLFSDTRFLNEIKEEQATKNKLRHLLVLFARLLALLFLILAFAQPFLPKNKNAASSEKLIQIYLDNSFSMQAEGSGFLLIDEAKNTAQKIIESYNESNKFQLLTNDFEAKHQRLLDKGEALEMLKEIKVSNAIQKKQLVYDKQVNNGKNFNGDRLSYIISDFQKDDSLFVVDTVGQCNLIIIENKNKRNISIDNVVFDAPIQLKGQNNSLLVQLSNQGEEEVTGSFQLLLNGEAKSIGNYTIAPNSTVVDTLQFTITEQGWNTGRITTNDYPLTFDDDYYFSFYVMDKMNVHNIYEAGGNKHIQAVFEGNEQVNYSSNSIGSVNYSVFDKQQLIVLSNLKTIPSGLSESIKNYTNNGGQVLIIPNKEADVASYNKFINAIRIGTIESKVNENRGVRSINLEHEVMQDLFSEKPSNLKLPIVSAGFKQLNNIKQQNILSFSDGSPYLSSAAVGLGTVYLLNSSLDNESSDFAQHAIFAPMLFKMAILGVRNTDISYFFNAKTNVRLNELPTNSESVLHMKNENIDFIPQKQIYNAALQLSFPGNGLQSGTYTVADDDKLYYAEIALNYNRKESFLNYFKLDELKENYKNTKIQVLENNLAQIGNNVKELEDGSSYWKICIILALLFLAVEILLLRFWPN